MTAAHIEASQILDKTPVGMTIFDIATGEITWANRSAADMLGIPQADFSLQALHTVSEIIDRQGNVVPPEQYALQLAADSKGQQEKVVGVRYTSGHTLWLNTRAVWGTIGGREVVVSSFSDITEIIEAQEREYTFIQNVSHELRTPLAIIYGYLDLLAAGDIEPLPAAAQEIVERLRFKAETLRLLVERSLGVLTAEQKISDQFEPVRVAALLDDTSADFHIYLRDMRKAITVTSRKRLGDAAVLGNRRLLWLVLNNLLTNAVKFTPDGGRVLVSAYCAAGKCVISVRDNGIGIPADKMEQIFDRFYQVDGSATRRYGGTGIGLHFARQVIRQHGGNISVRSQLDRGSVFRVELPLWKMKIN